MTENIQSYVRPGSRGSTIQEKSLVERFGGNPTPENILTGRYEQPANPGLIRTLQAFVDAGFTDGITTLMRTDGPIAIARALPEEYFQQRLGLRL